MSNSLVCALACSVLLIPLIAAAELESWVATWAASPEPPDADPNQPILNLQDQTVRQRVRISVGGSRVRICLTNEYGSSPVLVGSVTVAVPEDPESVKTGSIHAVTFGGRNSIKIPPGAPALSDPVALPVAYGAELSISLYFPGRVTPTGHALALKRAVVSPPGDHTYDEKIQGGTEASRLVLVDAVLVPAQPSQHLVVAFGDSLVDGDGSTLDADRNWPSDLIRRLAKTPNSAKLAVVNEGIAGNRLLANGPIASLGVSALARFGRDALSLPGVTHIVLLEGINDLGFPGARLGSFLLADATDVRSTEDLIGAYRQLAARAHARGIKLIGSTMTPCEGVDISGYYSGAKDATRQAVNKWIKNSGEFDGVIDFDAVLRDPDHPSRLLSRFASEDHLHPNDAGYQAMADAINLALFQ
ncbi:MAG: SGNH/GDSL hydrolase family protein [Bryobacteraceae bacterium]|jgi:lysophospholipase L1-like esterase